MLRNRYRCQLAGLALIAGFLSLNCSFGFELLDPPGTDEGTSSMGGADRLLPSDPSRGGASPQDGQRPERDDEIGAMGGDAAGGATENDTTEYCSGIPSLDSEPLLDGILEPGMVLETVAVSGWRSGSGTPEFPSGQSMRFAVAWRPDGLYVYAEVEDPDLNPPREEDQVWMGDAVEIFVDHDGRFDTAPPYFDLEGTRQFFVAAPQEGSDSGERAEIRYPIGDYDPWERDWISVPNPRGYVVEVFIRAAPLNLENLALESGQRIGFDLGHDVSHPPGERGVDGHRLGQYFLQIADPPSGSDDDYPFNNQSVFCTPELR